MELYTDIYYVQKILSGDTACFACILDRYSRQVFSLICKVVRNKEDAEELTQDVFIKVFRYLSSFKQESSFSTWLYRIAYNTAISETRKKKYEYPAIDEMLINTIQDDEFLTDDSSGRIDLLENALRLLPPEERMMILLFYMQDKTIDEVAEITGLSATNVKTKLFRIRKKLFVIVKKMEKEEI
ncbi:MAG: sigma-70 family RNA polymerase sigma factor [Tannerella sp.]|nr:sigma-70 family RNA polymerase sigma factor [Tannerella sp.]